MSDRSCSDAAFISSVQGFEAFPHVLRLIAEGRPVEIGQLAVAAGRSEPEVERVLRSQPGTEWDSEGRLVGFGLTQRPTGHRFTVEGRALYTWCATDTLLFPIVLGTAAVAESTCSATGEPIRVEIVAHGVVSVAPRDVVVSQRQGAWLGGDLRAEVCDHGHFFASRSAAMPWLADHPDGTVLSVSEVFENCRNACEELGWTSTGHARR